MKRMKRISDLIDAVKAFKGKKAIGKALSVSLLNQLISSGTNFAVVLYLVRVMEKSAFGIYSLGFALMLLLSGLILSSIAVQYVVNLPDQPQQERAGYAVHHANAVVVLGICLLMIAALVMALPADQFTGLASVQAIAMAVAAAAALYSVRDFLVRVAYSARREDYVLYSSVTIAVAVVLGYLALRQGGTPGITAADGLLVLGFGYAAGAVVLALLLKLPLASGSWRGVVMAFRESWRGGKWNVVTNVVYNIRSQAHNFIVAPLLGMAALAEVNAARVLVTPAVMAIPPLSQIIMPRLAEKRAQGASIRGRHTVLTIAVLAGFAAVYTLVLVPLLPWVLPLTLGGAYQHTGTLVVIWCLVAIVSAARNALTIVFQVAKRFRGLMLANSVAAAFAVAMAAFLSWRVGAAGAVMALGMAELVLCLLLIWLLQVQDQLSALNHGKQGGS